MTRLAALALAFVAAVGLTRAGPATAQSEDIFELLPAADLANGERQYNRCLGCHVIEPGQPSRAGPNLWGVFGRDIASADGFRYSQALTVIEGRWDVASLEHYLTDPRGFAPGTRKTLPGPRRTSDRADLIAWLASQSDNPIAPEDLVLDDLDMALLPPGPGREDTFYACIACHSIRIGDAGLDGRGTGHGPAGPRATRDRADLPGGLSGPRPPAADGAAVGWPGVRPSRRALRPSSG